MGSESVFTADPEAKDHQLEFLQGFIILFTGTCTASKISAEFIDLVSAKMTQVIKY